MQYEYDKDGIGGWLAFLMATMVIRALTLGHDFFSALYLISKPGAPLILQILGGMELAVVAVIIWAIYLVIVQDSRFRKMFVISVLGQLLLLISEYTTAVNFAISNIYTMDIAKSIFHTMVYGGIWIPYVYRSKRLKNRLDIIDVVAEVVEEEHGSGEQETK